MNLLKVDDYKELMDAGIINIDDLSQEEKGHLFHMLDKLMHIVYDFVFSYTDYMNKRRNYTDTDKLTMLEVHLLTSIAEQPHQTVTILARKWNRSVSATSQTIRKLLKKDLIIRTNSPDDAKVYFLDVTPRGREVSEAHKTYDIIDTLKTLKTLRHTLSVEEIDTFFKGMEAYNNLLRKSR